MIPASLPAERIALLAGLFSLALILGALGFQYIGHIAPCEMCHWQRWPHIAAAIIGIGGAFLLRGQGRLLAWLVVLLIVASGSIGAYQTGMQLGLLPGPQACTAAHAFVMGSHDAAPVVQCNVVTWSLFGLSLAAYNAILSFLVAAMATILLMKRS